MPRKASVVCPVVLSRRHRQLLHCHAGYTITSCVCTHTQVHLTSNPTPRGPVCSSSLLWTFQSSFDLEMCPMSFLLTGPVPPNWGFMCKCQVTFTQEAGCLKLSVTSRRHRLVGNGNSVEALMRPWMQIGLLSPYPVVMEPTCPLLSLCPLGEGRGNGFLGGLFQLPAPKMCPVECQQ